MSTVDETVQVERHCIRNFERLGFTPYEAILAVENGYDWHEIEDLIKRGCSIANALIIAAR